MSYDFGNSRLINGVAWGVVTSNSHPDGAYMVRVKLPWIQSSDENDDADFITTWCRVLTPMAGGKRGFYMLPEVDDEVLLAFVHGNIREPVVLGSAWNADDLPPHGGEAPADSEDPMGNSAGIADAATDTTDDANNARMIVSRSGSVLLFNDTEGAERVVLKSAKGSALVINDDKDAVSLYDAAKEVYLHLDKANDKITLESKNGDIDILCENGTFTLKAKTIDVYSSGNTDHKADGKWMQESGSTMDLKSGGTLTQKGPKIDLNP